MNTDTGEGQDGARVRAPVRACHSASFTRTAVEGRGGAVGGVEPVTFQPKPGAYLLSISVSFCSVCLHENEPDLSTTAECKQASGQCTLKQMLKLVTLPQPVNLMLEDASVSVAMRPLVLC